MITTGTCSHDLARTDTESRKPEDAITVSFHYNSAFAVVVQGRITTDGHNNNNKDSLKTVCSVTQCGKEFAFDGGDTRLLDRPLLIRAPPISTNYSSRPKQTPRAGPALHTMLECGACS
jgi:hypothetical protein